MSKYLSKPNPNKVAMFLPSLGGGGAEKSVVRLAAALDRDGVMVDLVLASADGPVLHDVPSTVRIVDLGQRRVMAALPGLIRYLKRERPAAIMSAMYHANLIAILAHFLASSSARLLVSERASFVALRRSQRSLKERMLRWAMRLLYRRADAIITVSKAIKTELVENLRLSADDIHAIYNPIISDATPALAEQDPGHPWFHEKTPVVVAAGRLAPEKDFASLLRAVALVARQRPIRLIILGDGPLEDDLTTLARELGIGDQVDLIGRQSNPWAYMKRAALFALCSISEGMPSVLVEALAVGTRVVSTDCPTGPREILGDGSPALVPVGDSDALANAIMVALDDRDPPRLPPLDEFTEQFATARYRRLLLA